MREIKVQLYRGEDDNYVELWKTVEKIEGKHRYYGRYTYGNEGTWYSVCDPLGYCELNAPMADDVMFICCDENGNEAIRYSNADGNKLPKFETVIKREWDKVKEKLQHNTEDLTKNFWAECWNGDTTMKINQWLLSYKDPDLYPEKANDYDENWTGCWAEKEIGYEPIPDTEFEYLGHKYQFTKVKHKHEYCGIEWYEFVCTDSPYVMRDTPWVNDRAWIQSYMYLGNWFDDKTYGTMYDQRSAREKVVAALIKKFPMKNKWDKLLYVKKKTGNEFYNCDCCYEKSYSDMADVLINRNYHRKDVDYLCKFINKETEGIVFASNRGNKYIIRQAYPDIYDYDNCLI